LRTQLIDSREELVASWNILDLGLQVNHAQVFSPFVFTSFLQAYLVFSGLATIANMGAEVGATTSTFPYSPNMRAYLNATGRAPVAAAADAAAAQGFLSADENAEYDDVIDIVWVITLLLIGFLTWVIEPLRNRTHYQWSLYP
jgi:hypothetical protein